MKSKYLVPVIAILASCHPGQQKDVQAPKEGAPVETKAPNSPDYKPAFPGQTRIGSVKTQTPLEVKILTEDLEMPWGVSNLPDGRLIITQKKGTMRIATTTGVLSAPITGIPPADFDGQGGLLDVAVDPDFANNRMLYWTFSLKMDTTTCTAVGKGKLSADEKTIEGATVIYRALPAFNSNLHYGGRMVFDKDGNLFIGTGERFKPESRYQAQSVNSGLGKVLHITKDGKPAAGNPFAGRADAQPEVYSYGHRNVQGLAIHPATGDLWEDEFGPRGGDEINLIQPGKNYGWPIITYGIDYSGEKMGDGITQKAGMEQPVYYWDPVVSPSGSAFYDGSMIPEWKNNLFIGALSGQHIVRLVIENNKVTGEERLLENEHQRFRDVAEGKDGALYAITDGGKGRLYRISRKN